MNDAVQKAVSELHDVLNKEMGSNVVAVELFISSSETNSERFIGKGAEFRPIITHKQRVIDKAILALLAIDQDNDAPNETTCSIDPMIEDAIERLYDLGMLSMPNDKEEE